MWLPGETATCDAARKPFMVAVTVVVVAILHATESAIVVVVIVGGTQSFWCCILVQFRPVGLVCVDLQFLQ